MDVLVSWVLFPAVLLVVLIGCGLLVRGLVAVAIPTALLPGVGLAVLICVGHLTTATDSTAELTTPVAIGLAAAGYLGAWPLGWRAGMRAVTPAAAAGAGAFLVYGAPIVLSGDATFAGFIKLDDTATWLALTDRVIEHGRNLDGLPPSSYEATLAFNLTDGYPIGAFLPLAVGSQLTGTDVAWTIQPYIALLAGLLAAALAELARPVVPQPAIRSAVAFLAAQPALLVGYALWGGLKEVEAATLIALCAALTPLTRLRTPASVAPLAVAVAALLAVLSLGGAIWVAPTLAGALFLLWRGFGREAGKRVVLFGAIVVVVLLPLIGGGQLLPPTSSPLTSPTAQGNLLEPLSFWQLFGIWPVGDFRLRPDESAITAIAIAIAFGAGILGAMLVRRRGALGAGLYIGGSVLACVALVLLGSPWVDGKALATASPAVLFAAMLGIAALWDGGLRAAAALALCIVAGGVLISNVLAYRDVFLAPRDQLAELEQIGERLEGEGPILMTEYNPYGVRHFLRDAQPEGASELRRHDVPLRSGELLGKGQWSDTDPLDPTGLLFYRTLVVRRSPAQSRPPSSYELVSSGDYYDVWQRPPGELSTETVGLPLGGGAEPGAVPSCPVVESLAESAGGSASLAFARRVPNVVVATAEMRHPAAWDDGATGTLVPRSDGSASVELRLPRRGRWTVWVGGSVRGRMEARVDGKAIGSIRHLLNNDGLYTELGSEELEAGEHTVELRYTGADLHPGSGGRPAPIGPLVLSLTDPATVRVESVPASRAAELCGEHLDWIEALPGSQE